MAHRALLALRSVHPFFLCYALFVLVQYPISVPAPTTVSFFALLLPVFLAYGYRERKALKIALREPVMAALLALMAFILLHSVFLAPEQKQLFKTFSNTIATGFYILMTMLFFAAAEPRFLRRFLTVFSIVVSACSLASIVYHILWFTPEQVRLVPIGRASHEILGALCYGVAGLTAQYLGATETQAKRRAGYYAMVAIIGLLILMTQSRMPIFAYSVCLICGTLLYSPRRWRSLLQLIAFAVATGSLFYLLSHAIADWYQAEALRRDKQYNPSLPMLMNSSRYMIWNVTLEGIRAHPWIGNGIRAMIALPGVDMLYPPHNIYLATAYYLGIPAALFFGAILARCCFLGLTLAISGDKLSALAAMLMLQGFISGLTEHGQLVKAPSPLWIIFWLPVGLALAQKLKHRP